MERLKLWSSGGGVQSTAIAALIVQGKLKPDLSVIVDTEREMSGVWTYLEQYVQPALRQVGVELHRVAKSRYATVDLYRNEDILIPAWTDESGKIGKLPTYCSNEWKKRVVRRWATDVAGKQAKFNTWIGFSMDETRRLYQEPGRWEPTFPLIDLRMTRDDCLRVVEEVGWPAPPKSSCWMCPNRDHAAWVRMKHESPQDWKNAVEFEREIRLKDDALYLHKDGVPLDQVKMTGKRDDPFTGRCDSGYCYT